MTFYILHLYCREMYGNTCQISQIQCYVSVITEKYDLLFQLTYHTLAFDFQTSAKRHHALLEMSRIQQTVVLDLRTSNILISVLPTIDQLVSKTCHLEGNQKILKTKRYTENTLFRRKIEMVNVSRCSSSRIRCIPKAQYHLSYLLRRHSGKIR